MSADLRVIVKRVWANEPIPVLWIAMPWPPADTITPIPGTGRRVIEMPEGTVLAATWTEAIRYATTGIPPQPIDQIHPEWCGLSP